MSDIHQLINYFKYQNGLKLVLRNNWAQEGRKESSAEHSWSVTVMAWMLSDLIGKEMNIEVDQSKVMKMALIHDIVEIDAGDVGAWDKEGREQVAERELVAINNISLKYFESDESEVKSLWLEHDELQTLESKIVKASDQLCPLIYRIVFKNSYEGTGVDRQKLDEIFLNIVGFSETTRNVYNVLAQELEDLGLFDTVQ